MTISHMTSATSKHPIPTAPLPATAYAVLGLLSFGRELSGYDLKKWADHSVGHFYWSPAMSNVYAELRRLESLGLAEPVRTEVVDVRNRRMFRITEAGRLALAAWLPQELPRSVVSKDHLLLRVWLGHAGEDADLLRLVEQEQAAVEQTLVGVEQTLNAVQDGGPFGYSPLVYRFSTRMAEARREALAELRAELVRRIDSNPTEVLA